MQVKKVLEEKNEMIAKMREEIQGMKLSLGLPVTTDQHQVSTEQHQVSSGQHKVSTDHHQVSIG